MSAPDVLVTVRLDRPTYRAWRAKADRDNTDVGLLLALAARHALTSRPPEGRKANDSRRRLTDEQRAEILAERSTSSSVLAARFGVTGQTIRNVWKAGR